MLQVQSDGETTIDLIELFHALLKRWWLILMGGLIGILVAGVYTYQIATPIYQASAAIYMRGSGNTVASLQDLQLGAYTHLSGICGDLYEGKRQYGGFSPGSAVGCGADQ